MKVTVNPGAECALNPVWSFGANTCHAPLWLRPDLQGHMALACRELGFRYIRAHGILSDNMQVVDEHGKLHFGKMNRALHALLATGCKPFVELSAMPGKFASSESKVCRYTFRSAPPRDWQMWQELIGGTLDNLLREFGEQELADWYFEVWNEPDIAFWSGTQREYFRLYDIARREIKRRCSNLRVGGPATSKTAWIDDFLRHVSAPSEDDPQTGLRCDFVSTHAYPSDVEFLDAAQGQVVLKSASLLRELFTEVRRKVDAVAGRDFPVIAGEWNSSAGPLAQNHDDCNNAAFVVKIMTELAPLTQGSLYWNLSDIYEECGFHNQPFHGGYGLLSVNDIRKASFNAFALLNRLGGRGVPCEFPAGSEELGGLAAQEGGTVQVLLHHYIEPDNHMPQALEVEIAGLPVGEYALCGTTAIEPHRGSAFEEWLALGRPEYPSIEILTRLLAASQMREETPPPEHRRITLQPGGVYLLRFVRGK